MPDGPSNVDHWRRTVAEHRLDHGNRATCAHCGAYWPCWELAYAREQLILSRGSVRATG